jgi:hypothetical protein
MKKICKIILAIFIFFFIAVYANAEQEFVGSKTSNKYHYPTCEWVKEIKSHKLIKFDSPEAAIKAGYMQCPTCRPPLPVPDSTTIVKDSDKQNSKKAPVKSYNFNIIFGSLLLLLLFIVPFLPGLLEMVIDRDSSFEITGKKDPTQ